MSDAAKTAARPRPSWRQAAGAYRDPRIITMFFMGISAGLPLILVFATLSVWLRDVGVSRTSIGFFSWIAATYGFKFLWAPLVDRLALPTPLSLLGRRRSWIVLAIVGVMVGIIGMAFTDPGAALWQMALFAFIVAASSATQDIALDAFRIESAPEEMQGAAAGAYQAGYMLAIKIIGGALALYLAEYISWSAAYLAMAGFMLVGLVTILIRPEPQAANTEATDALLTRIQEFSGIGGRRRNPMAKVAAWFTAAVIGPFSEFFSRNGWWALLILALIGVYRLSDITLGVMAGPFYIDLGFTKDQIANATKLFGLLAAIGGALFGGFVVLRIGVLPALFAAAITVIATNLLFGFMALIETRNFWLLTVIVSTDSIAAGMAGSAFIAYLSSLTSIQYTATQYALLTSIMLLPGKLVAGFSGVIVDAVGYVLFFAYASVLGVPALILVLVLARMERRGIIRRKGDKERDGLVEDATEPAR
ncbi:MAG: MFS transporter [Rhodospirillaceae bacterium]|nr:MFS transporter [Rhodospirillaceae bacterium]